MRVQVTPQRVEWIGGEPIQVQVTVTNTGDLIGGYRLRVLGADPGWVTLEAENISLFPGTSEQIRATIRIPDGIGAGDRRIAIQVRELTPPGAIAVAEIDLVVPAKDSLHIHLSPMTVQGGRVGRFGVTCENTGNRPIDATLVGLDPEHQIRFAFIPPVVSLAPGEIAITDMQTRAKRRWFGSPVVRNFQVGIAPPPEITPAPEVEPLAQGNFLQKSWVGRGAISLLGLLFAVTVFAVVITLAMSKLVGNSAADRDLALQVAAARSSSAESAGSSGMSGTVTLLTSGSGAPGVTVELFTAGDLTTPLTSVATSDTGTWAVKDIGEGTYKLRFRGAGFAEVWFPSALTGDSAEEVKLGPGQQAEGIDVVLGGLPATISGKVIGEDVAGALLTVQIPPTDLPPDAGANPDALIDLGAEPLPYEDPATRPGAVVQTLPLSGDGEFLITDLSSPSVYDLVVSKPGYATATQRVDLAGGENRKDIEIRLRTGDGLITGMVNGPDGPLGEAIVTATLGQTVITTVSLTEENVGEFTLRGLATPASYAVTVSLPGYTSTTSTLTLSAGQKLDGVQLTLTRASGSLAGRVTTLIDNAPAPGVTVTVAAGERTISTVTQSAGDVGSWTVTGLPVPSTYTITFSRPDLQSQTVAVSLDAAGQVTSGSQGEGITAGGISVGMKSAFAEIFGVVTQSSAAQGTSVVGEATLTLSSGTDTYTVTSASIPAADAGKFRIGGVVPGTYTLSVSRRGTAPTSAIITLTAGQVLEYNPELIPPASITGRVTNLSGEPQRSVSVLLYLSTRYPAETYATTTTDANGRYRFDDVDAPQSYVVEARSTAAGALGSTTVVLSASQAGVGNITVGDPDRTTTTPPPPTTTTPPTSSSTPTGTTGTSTTGTPTTSQSSTTPSSDPASTETSDPGNPVVPASTVLTQQATDSEDVLPLSFSSGGTP